MQPADWDDPSIRAIGRKWRAEAYDLASELHGRGADASPLLRSESDPTRPPTVSIPAMLADVVMAVLLALPRREGGPDRLWRECQSP